MRVRMVNSLVGRSCKLTGLSVVIDWNIECVGFLPCSIEQVRVY